MHLPTIELLLLLLPLLLLLLLLLLQWGVMAMSATWTQNSAWESWRETSLTHGAIVANSGDKKRCWLPASNHAAVLITCRLAVVCQLLPSVAIIMDVIITVFKPRPQVLVFLVVLFGIKLLKIKGVVAGATPPPQSL